MKLTRRMKFIVSSLLAIAWMVAVVIFVEATGTSLADAQQIKPGMTKHQAEAILGPTPDPSALPCALIGDWRLWACSDGTCSVACDRQDRVLWCNVYSDHCWFTSTWRRIRWRFGYFP